MEPESRPTNAAIIEPSQYLPGRLRFHFLLAAVLLALAALVATTKLRQLLDSGFLR
jgi:hypothetical protein